MGRLMGASVHHVLGARRKPFIMSGVSLEFLLFSTVVLGPGPASSFQHRTSLNASVEMCWGEGRREEAATEE